MKYIITYIAVLFSFHSCQWNNEKSDAPQTASDQYISPNTPKIQFDIEKHLANYQNLKVSIAKHQQHLSSRNDLRDAARFELAEKYISTILIDSIFEYWLDTPWDFNGYTDQPRKGEIACGYFVSTTLRDVGVKLNRYKVAQKGASDIIFDLCDTNTIKKKSSYLEVVKFMESAENDELFIVGLDFHVGFIFKRGGKNYFIHSNYIDRKGVEIEIFEHSVALKNSEIYVIGNFSKNKKMLKKWLR